jgi:hypothetical protein
VLRGYSASCRLAIRMKWVTIGVTIAAFVAALPALRAAAVLPVLGPARADWWT